MRKVILNLNNLFYFRKRCNSPYINHFISADTIVPNPSNPQSWNRYSYVSNNPLRYTDPTGHMQASDSYQDHDGKCAKSDKGCNDLVERIKKKKDKKCAYQDSHACNQGKKRTPDYVSLNVGGSIPGVGTLISGQLSITLDRFGNFYLGPGLSIGPEAPLGFSASLSAGFIDTWSNSLVAGNPAAPAPGEQRSEEVLSGGYANGMICIVFCGGLTNSLSNLDNVGFEVLGIGVPQASVGGGTSYLVGDLKSNNNNGVPLW